MEYLANSEAHTHKALYSLLAHTAAGKQHLEILSHAGRGDQVFKLQGNLRSLLWDATILEDVGKLILLANPHQKSRLRKQFLDSHTGFRASTSKCGEIHVGRQILLSRSLIGIRTCGVMPVSHQRAAVMAGELLVASVTVIDDQQYSARNRTSVL